MIDTREQMLAHIDQAWEKHSQPVTLNVPAGAESFVRHECILMSQRGFLLAAMDLVDHIIHTDQKNE